MLVIDPMLFGIDNLDVFVFARNCLVTCLEHRFLTSWHAFYCLEILWERPMQNVTQVWNGSRRSGHHTPLRVFEVRSTVRNCRAPSLFPSVSIFDMSKYHSRSAETPRFCSCISLDLPRCVRSSTIAVPSNCTHKEPSASKLLIP